MRYQAIQHCEEDVRVQVLLSPTVAYSKYLVSSIRLFLKKSKAAKRAEYYPMIEWLGDYADLLEGTREYRGPERAAYVLTNGQRLK